MGRGGIRMVLGAGDKLSTSMSKGLEPKRYGHHWTGIISTSLVSEVLDEGIQLRRLFDGKLAKLNSAAAQLVLS